MAGSSTSLEMLTTLPEGTPWIIQKLSLEFNKSLTSTAPVVNSMTIMEMSNSDIQEKLSKPYSKICFPPNFSFCWDILRMPTQMAKISADCLPTCKRNSDGGGRGEEWVERTKYSGLLRIHKATLDTVSDELSTCCKIWPDIWFTWKIMLMNQHFRDRNNGPEIVLQTKRQTDLYSFGLLSTL